MVMFVLSIILCIVFCQVGGRTIRIMVKSINKLFDNIEQKVDNKKEE